MAAPLEKYAQVAMVINFAIKDGDHAAVFTAGRLMAIPHIDNGQSSDAKSCFVGLIAPLIVWTAMDHGAEHA